MELSEKIQKLRKERGLTQEQLAEQLFVSRTAVSKWETGRGTPSVDSLRMIAKLYGITLDELLGAEEVITIAKHENKKNISQFASYMDGIFNVSAIMCLLLPLYKVEMNDVFYSVPLFQFKSWLAPLYWTIPIIMAICGVIQILINKTEHEKVKKTIKLISIIVNVSAIILLILSGQPYPSILFFVLLLAKGVVMRIKQK